MSFLTVNYSDAGSSFEPIKPGEYEAIITEVELTKSNNSGADMIKATLTLRDDVQQQFAKRKVFDYLTAVPDAMFKFQQVAKAIGMPEGQPINSIAEFAQIIKFKAVRVKIANEKGHDKEGNERINDSIKFYDLAKAQVGAPQAAAPSPFAVPGATPSPFGAPAPQGFPPAPPAQQGFYPQGQPAPTTAPQGFPAPGQFAPPVPTAPQFNAPTAPPMQPQFQQPTAPQPQFQQPVAPQPGFAPQPQAPVAPAPGQAPWEVPAAPQAPAQQYAQPQAPTDNMFVGAAPQIDPSKLPF